MSEVMSNVVMPVLLALLSTALGAMGWFLKGLREDVASLSSRVAGQHEHYASRVEMEKLRDETTRGVHELRNEIAELRSDVQTGYVDKEAYIRSTMQHQMTLEEIRKQLSEVMVRLSVAASKVLGGRDGDQ